MAVAEGGDPTNVIGRRIVGAFFETLIDSLLLYTMFSVAGIKVKNQLGTLAPESYTQQSSKVGVVFTIYIIYIVATKVLTLAYVGWTPGMLMMGLRCVKVDGRPIGLGRALARTVFYMIYSQLGCLFYLTVTLPMWNSKAHKGFQDMLVGSFVIDGIYRGHLLMAQPDGRYIVGPMSVTRAEAEKFLREQGAPVQNFETPAQANLKNGEPFMDKNLGTYVVWNNRQQAWLAFDKATSTWNRIG